MPRSPRTRRASLLVAATLLVAARPAEAISYKLARTLAGAEYSFGNAIAANERHLVVGASFEHSASGAVYVYDRATGTLQAHLSSPAPRYFFGQDVALDGDLVVVGEQRGGMQVGYDDGGAVHLFDADTGAFVRTLVNPEPTEHFDLGTAVAAADGVVVASAPYLPWLSPTGGVVYVFDAATGQVLHTLRDPTPEAGDFGADVAIADGELFVGDARYDEPGTVWRFDLATGALLGSLHHPDPDVRGFGAPIAVEGTHVVVGGTEAVFVFDRATGSLERTFTTPFPDASYFGLRLDIGGAGIAISQPPVARWPVRSAVGAVLLYDPASGAIRTTIAEPIGANAPDFGRPFGRSLLLDHEDVFVSAGTDDVPTVLQYVLACGDGVLDPCEQCDDGNRVAGDGCDADCRLESCGDGVVQAGEACDDGNAVDGDGCDSTCYPLRLRQLRRRGRRAMRRRQHDDRRRVRRELHMGRVRQRRGRTVRDLRRREQRRRRRLLVLLQGRNLRRHRPRRRRELRRRQPRRRRRLRRLVPPRVHEARLVEAHLQRVRR